MNMTHASTPTNPPQIIPMSTARPRRLGRKPAAAFALDLIDSNIGPLGFEPDLQAEIRKLHGTNNVRGMIALFTVYRDIGETFIRMLNQPYASDVYILEDEYSRAWSKAYLVAEALKTMRPADDTEKEYMAEALFCCAHMTGHSLTEAISIAGAVASTPNGAPLAKTVAARKDSPKSCKLADLATTYDQIASLVFNDHNGTVEIGNAVDNALTDRLSEIREEATGLAASSAAGAAFAILLAYCQVDLTTNGIDEATREDAQKQVEKLLYAARDYFHHEFAAMPGAAAYSMPDRTDPRKAVR